MVRRWTTFAMMMAVAGMQSPALAQEALILGNEDYDRGVDVTRGAAVVDAARALEVGGAVVVSGRDVTGVRQQELLAAFEKAATGNAARLAVLSGRFVTAGSETWFLPVDAQATSLTALPREAIPLSSVMAMLGSGSGTALLVLGADSADGDAGLGPFVTAGIGAVEPSQGVVVIKGTPRDVSGLLRDVLAVPGARIADGIGGRGLTVQGDLANASFLSGATPAAAAPAAAPPPAASPDTTAWRQARDGNTIAGYVDYLDRYPQGQHAGDASARLESLRNDPRVQARAVEDSLSLNRAARQAVQGDLTALGFDTNGVDGLFGTGSRRAISRWQSSVGLPQTSYLDAGQINRLRAAAAAVAPAPSAPPASTSNAAADANDWVRAQQIGTARAYNDYLQSYPNGVYADEARSRLAALQRPPSPEEQLNDLLQKGISDLLRKN